MKVVPPDHPAFQAVPVRQPKDTGRVAPGIDVVYRILFTPTEKQDYEYDLVVLTERDKLIVPIRAVGARGLLPIASCLLTMNRLSRFPIGACVPRRTGESNESADFPRAQHWVEGNNLHGAVRGTVCCHADNVASRCTGGRAGHRDVCTAAARRIRGTHGCAV